MRVLAILAAYNEERFIAPCLEHLFSQGVEVYLIDNSSTDRTVSIAESFIGKGLIGIENLPREGKFSLTTQLKRKEQLFSELEADWYIHLDADEIRLPPSSNRTLAQAFQQVGEQGYNAINFFEYTFVPTREAPDHDHSEYQKTMRWYYPFLPSYPHRLNAWKRQPVAINLSNSGGHRVQFPELRMYPENFVMRHYLYLSVSHALSKYVKRSYDEYEIKTGWHSWRARLLPDSIELPSQSELRKYISDDLLDSSNPRKYHYLDDKNAVKHLRK
jgi:glycosyltransferase involved in cell wall biosynthesis